MLSFNQLSLVKELGKIFEITLKIENLYKIIERKGGDFNLSEEEINLANRLVY